MGGEVRYKGFFVRILVIEKGELVEVINEKLCL